MSSVSAPLADCRVVSFDACDTIIAADPPYPEVVFRACEKLGFDVTRETVRGICRAASAANLQALADAWREGRQLPSGAFFQTWRRAFREDPHWPDLTDGDFTHLTDELVGAFSRMVAMDGAAEVLAAVRDSGRKLVVTSNFDDTLEQVLDDCGIAHFFDAIVASHAVNCEKPDPGIYRIALERVGAQPDEAVHVGDSIFDHLGAQKAGLRGVWLRTEASLDLTDVPEPDATIGSLRDLLPLLGIESGGPADAH